MGNLQACRGYGYPWMMDISMDIFTCGYPTVDIFMDI